MAATLDDAKKSEIVKLHDRGMEPAEIGRQLNVGHVAVHSHLREHELELLRAGGGPLLTPAEIAGLEVHEWCYAYREMTEEQLELLADSIAEDVATDGRLDAPILVWRRKWIIDGRNRFMAARNRGIKLGPTCFANTECEEAEARRKVDRLNLERRHLSQKEEEHQRSQRAMRAATKAMGENGGKLTRESREQAAKEAGVSHGYVAYAAEIAKKAPEAAEQVAEGKKTIQDARRDAGLDRRHVTRTEPENRTTLDQVKEEYDERQAIRDQDSDEAWVEGLELYGKLSGKNREMFVRDALAYRHLKAARRAWGQAVAGELKGNRRTPSWLSKQERALAVAGPEHWDFCSSEDGGCDGEGSLPFGDGEQRCGNCFGHGYILR